MCPVRACVRACVCVHIYVYMYVCMYIYVYVAHGYTTPAVFGIVPLFSPRAAYLVQRVVASLRGERIYCRLRHSLVARHDHEHAHVDSTSILVYNSIPVRGPVTASAVGSLPAQYCMCRCKYRSNYI